MKTRTINPHPLALAIALALGTPLAGAATLTVTSATDSGPGSLRQAIADAAAGDVIVFDSSLSGKTITLTSGELVLDKNLTIDGDIDGDDVPDVILDGNASSRVFSVTSGAEVTLDALAIRNGKTNLSGGGVFNDADLTIRNSALSGNFAGDKGGGVHNTLGILSIQGSILSGNSAHWGGGISNFANGSLSIQDSTLSGNFADNGGGIHNWSTLSIQNSTLSGNSASYGGGVYNRTTLSIQDSTLSGNSAGSGGGVYNTNLGTGALNIRNSTLSGNSARYSGGGVKNYRGTLSIQNSTLSGNSASLGGGVYRGTLTISNSVIAHSGGGNCHLSIPLSVDDTNWFDDTSCNGTDSGDPLLGSLADNGGPTLTMLPQVGSGLIDAGNDATCEETDQRGIPRPEGVTCDIGAVERLVRDQCSGTLLTITTDQSYTGPGATWLASEVGIDVTGSGTLFTASPHWLILEAPGVGVQQGVTFRVEPGALLRIRPGPVTCL